MSQPFALNQPMINVFSKFTGNKISRYILLLLVGVTVLTIGSKIVIPLKPVPVTLQTLMVLFIGMVYGPRLGALTVATYIGLGAIGLPLLAPAPMMTWGYVVGFIPAAYLSGWLIQRGWGNSINLTMLAALIGILLIFAIGLPWLAFFIGWVNAIKLGFMPFILTEIAKIIVLSVSVPWFWHK